MSFDWGEYINLAEALIENNPDEARMRSATSRAYYGSFIKCRTYRGFNIRTKDVHKRVIEDFKESDIIDEITLGNHLDILRKKRNDADYDGIYKPSFRETSNNISIARKIVHLLAKVRDEN